MKEHPLKERIIDGFRRIYPASPKPRVFRAPGRVNLIGEHTDYNLGFVCPAALELACFVAAAPNPAGRLRVYSENREELREWPVSDLPECRPAGNWTDYAIGVAQQLLRANHAIEALDLYVFSTVPTGSGLSSSAALEVSTALALLGGRALAPLELALLAQRAENEFVGMPCGIMDPYVSVFGRDLSAVKIDCRDLGNIIVPIPESVEILAVNSMVKHELGQSAYRERVRECASAVEAMRSRHPHVTTLRDADLEMVHELGSGPPALLQRARHVVSENLRVNRWVEAAAAGDLANMGALFVESHRSLQNDYQVSCPELDFLVDTALTLPGVWGARMTGGGFGGCTVNLVEPRHVAAFREGIAAAYRDRFGIVAEIHSCRPSAGAGEI
ncbi:MAG: galactokinase [Acidobacteriia bacterium]|nr:galactokinase [Terriglobia bacterium]